jgi:hypothetical protein
MRSYLILSVIFISTSLLSACSTASKRVLLEESGSKPGWVSASRAAWEEDGKIYLRITQQVRGNERATGCYDIARGNGKAALLAEIQEDVKALTDQFQGSLAENAEIVLQKSVKTESSGKIGGLRFVEEYYQRYSLADAERIDCYVLAEIQRKDYDSLKRRVVDGVMAADARVKEAITSGHIDFFAPKAARDGSSANSNKQ